MRQPHPKSLTLNSQKSRPLRTAASTLAHETEENAPCTREVEASRHRQHSRRSQHVPQIVDVDGQARVERVQLNRTAQKPQKKAKRLSVRQMMCSGGPRVWSRPRS